MKSRPAKTHYKHQLIAITLCLAGTTAYAEENSSNGIRNFLSDPHRVGSLTGTIIGGALTAHPVGVVAGSVIGYYFGKETMHKSTEQQLAQASYARASIIPSAFAERGQQFQKAGSRYTFAPSSSAPSVGVPLQIAAHCYGNNSATLDPKRQSMCYYYLSS